jgi:branched-chain amino acid transport system permease protein
MRAERSRQQDTPEKVEKTEKSKKSERASNPLGFLNNLTQNKIFLGTIMAMLIVVPFTVSNYQTSILITAMMYVILGLGLNIVVGMAGLLDLGYVAFYATGAYTYALLHTNFGFGFWTCLPLAGMLAATMGILLGIPVLRLRGDYLAIVTLGFGEIIRMILENWDEVTHGPSGIPNIPKPGLFGIDLGFHASTIYLYYITIVFMVITIIIIRRLHISRIGRAWLALREDEIACQAMGVDKVKTKLTAFALGAFWAGFVGVIFAAKGSFVNPPSFTFFESAIILSIVVLGGMGSIRGVIMATIVLVLLPEYLRFFQEYRMATFGAIMVIMMVFRPQGLISDVQHKYELIDEKASDKQPTAQQPVTT